MTLREQLVAGCSGSGDAAFDRPPPLLARGVLESNLEHAGCSLVDIALDADSTSCVGSPSITRPYAVEAR